MERLYILAPAVVATGYFVLMFAVYCVMVWAGRAPQVGTIKTNEVLGAFWTRYIVWLLSPLERALIRSHVSPNIITGLSLAACAGAGIAMALGHLATACWLYIAGGLLDLLDGRIARAQGRQTPAGALFDSVADRWAEIALFTGYAWYLRDTGWLLAVMAALGGSLMVSYTRARGEGLGVELKVGAMQRAERILLVALGTGVAAWMGAAENTREWVAPSAGIALAICGLLSSWTALGRWLEGYRALLAKQPAPERRREPEPVRVDRAAEAAMRITGEHTA
ncbi:MAG TPA: CDP-alcohol phosphatidyltransferase family protein [Kofleriaceae bacterium]|nr:CDP-alcohol phosphatidyltransferase family protein [Kofleriaceae bacterium]